MKINLLIFVTSTKGEQVNAPSKLMMKTVESDIRPIKGDILDDPGFDPGFHNGYEVVKVTIRYASNECFVSLTPLLMDREEISMESYVERLAANGWRAVPKEELPHI
ncbi:hypothetical protein ACFOGI_11405 [Virgibacillus xinjiangensis]|uniref:Uncharacterized protein n=1 Tax=Virgibacillus xinjiangensis TaxID=393090 RepID=A0ABV7CXF6_9BACI